MISVISVSIRPEGLSVVQKCLSEQTYTDWEWIVELSVPERGHDLNRSYNRALKRAKGDIIVSYQDFIKVEPDFLENVAKLSLDNPRTFYTCPVGKTTNFESKKVKWDYRAQRETIDWSEWEIDLGFAPKEALLAIGGFDEELDKYWSFDNASVGYRAMRFDYQFAVAPMKGIAYDHDKTIKHPFRKDYNPDFYNQRLEYYKFHPKLTYL